VALHIEFIGLLRRLLNRPKLYYDIDGLDELGAGAMSAGIGLLLSLPANVWHKVS